MNRKLEGLLLSTAVAMSTTSCADGTVLSMWQGPMPSVNLDVLPDTLPETVSAQLPNVVALHMQFEMDDPDGQGNVVTSYKHADSSGVRVDADRFITAGHALYDADGDQLKGIDSCGAISIDIATPEPTATTHDKEGNELKLFGTNINALKHSGTYVEDEPVPDVALVQAPNELPYTTPTRLYDGPPTEPGSPVFFANYEPTDEGAPRTPYETSLSTQQIRANMNKPAVLGGVALKYEDDGELVVATGLKSYGPTEEVHVRGGSSGGPVYNAAGDMIGTIVATVATDETPTGVDEFEELAEVDVTGVDPDAPVQYTVVRPITPDMAATLNAQLDAAPDCN